MLACFHDILRLHKGQAIDESEIFEFADYINARRDCSDFRLLTLLKVYCAYGQLLSRECRQAIQACALHFKYFMDEPGEDRMCFWSENHYVLFAACEYLAGQLFPEEFFPNNGQTGAWHKENARKKLLTWLEQKYKYGFIEWYSNVYYTEDIAPLSVLIDHAKDEDLTKKCAIVLNLLLLDIALQSYDGVFCPSMGRTYEKHVLDTACASVNTIARCAFEGSAECDGTGLSTHFVLRQKYRVPQVLVKIAHCRDKMHLKTSMGFDFGNLRAEIPDEAARALVLWQMEAFTNPDAIESTMELFNKWHLQNSLLKDLGKLNIPLLRKLHLLPAVSRILNPVTNGTALTRADVLTVKNEYWLLSAAQNHRPFTFGDQQHIWHACLPGNIDIFSTHPGCPLEEAGMRSQSPAYWVGNGILPFAAQHNNVLLLAYRLDVRKGLLEKPRQKMVHFYVPFAKFDELQVTEHCFCGRKADSYIGICSTAPMEKGQNELIAHGNRLHFAVIMGDTARHGSYAQFRELVGTGALQAKGDSIRLQLGSDRYEVKMQNQLRVNGEAQPLRYDRFDTPFVKAKRGDDMLNIRHNGHALQMQWSTGMLREV